MSRFKYIVLCGLLLALVVMPQVSLAQQFDLERIKDATVFIMQTSNIGNDLVVNCIASGTIVNRNGLILTNAHSTLRSEACPGDTLVIAFNVGDGQAPIPKYRAEITQADPGLDLALLAITRQFDGRIVEPSSLALPFVEIGDSETVNLDNTITVVGYPGIGDDPVAVTYGTVSGFTAEPSAGEKSWIKTFAEIPGTMSGGGAYNQRGQLIGIPITAPISNLDIETTCVPIQDTNRDGLVNQNDTCIPVGGFINSLRPSNFARPLLQAAALGLNVDFPLHQQRDGQTSGAPGFKRLFFSPSVNEAGMPTGVIRTLPTGSNSLYLFFDYENMTPETVYELRVTVDGIPNQTFSLAPVRWSGGQNGLWYLGSSQQTWPNGLYHFTLFADGIASGNAQLIIGRAPEPAPMMSDIVFGLLDNQGTPLGNGFVLPTGSIASARFLFRNMEPGIRWTAIWYYNGIELVRTEDSWSTIDGGSGSKTINLAVATGLLSGNYRLELYIDNSLSATADFIIAGAQQDAHTRVFQNMHFSTANSVAEAVNARPVSSFPNQLNTLYGLFDWEQLATGTPWTLRLTVDNNVFYEQTAPWGQNETGQDFLIRITSQSNLPDGTYRMSILINNVLLIFADAQVGIGQLPIDRFAQAQGLQLQGQILDAETRQGIPNVSFIIISEDFSVGEFRWREDQIFARTVTDRNGNFQLDRLLQYETPYSVVVIAEGYLPIAADGYRFRLDADPPPSNPFNAVIYLTKG
jgi:hypothetical protein